MQMMLVWFLVFYYIKTMPVWITDIIEAILILTLSADV